MHGAQMVAFNMQRYGKYLWLMNGIFRSNGGCGYVKKPDFLVNAGPHKEVFNPKYELPVKKTLEVKVYLGDRWHMSFKQTYFEMYSPGFYVRENLSSSHTNNLVTCNSWSKLIMIVCWLLFRVEMM